MPITVHCPHDKAELELVPDNKSPEGLLSCPKCKCLFRVCLGKFDGECYIKMYPKSQKIAEREDKGEIKKRGRPKKVEKETTVEGTDGRIE